MTRGMFVKVLANKAGINTSQYAGSSFSDVKAGTWYAGPVEWAAENNIVAGIGGGKFAPNRNVTREQMAVILYNYARQAHVIDSLTRISKEKHPVDVGAWGEFRVGDLFDVQRGQRHVVHNHEPGDIPYYSASLVNNGVTDLIGNPLFVANDAIVVTTFGDAFWADGNFTASDECSILTHSNMNELSGLFVATAYMAHNKRKYSFKLKAFSGRVADDVVFLPVTPGGEPDWSYMEQYMRTVMDRQEHVVRCLKKIKGV